MISEAIANTDEAKKQGGETKAAKRCVKRPREAHIRQRFILDNDGLMFHQPMIETALKHDMHFLFVAKPDDHSYLLDWINTFSALPFREYKDDNKRTHQFFWQNEVPLNGKADAIKVNYVEYR